MSDGDVFGWNRGDAGSTYNGWDFFEAVVPPADPFLGFVDSTPDVDGQFGATGSISVGMGAIAVGSGNAYSPFAPLSFTSILPTGAGASNTRIVAQFQTGGSELDYDSILLSRDSLIAGTIAPTFVMETGRSTLGGFGGDVVDYLALWDLAESQEEYRIDFEAASSSLSLQEFHVDTFTSENAFVSPTVISAIPEPSSLAVLGLVSGYAITWRRRRRRIGDFATTK